MFLLALALSFVQPASACAMPRMEMVKAQPGPLKEAEQAPKPAQDLEDVLAEIDQAATAPAPVGPANANAVKVDREVSAPPTAAAPAS